MKRKDINRLYSKYRDTIFKLTKDNPKRAHHIAAYLSRVCDKFELTEKLLDQDDNHYPCKIDISNAAGLNKDYHFSSRFLAALGFTRFVVGTVTADPWPGNSGMIVWRHPGNHSLENNEGLPGDGAYRVFHRIGREQFYSIPGTVNVMSTPKKKLDEQLKDISATLYESKRTPVIDLAELNISCPNINHGGEDKRKQIIDNLSHYLDIMDCFYPNKYDVKLSPDNSREEYESMIEAISNHKARGLTIFNTAKKNIEGVDPENIRGGFSGGALDSILENKIPEVLEIIAGGDLSVTFAGNVNSTRKVCHLLELAEAYRVKVNGIQIYTPLVYQGPKLVSEFRDLLNIKPRQYISPKYLVEITERIIKNI